MTDLHVYSRFINLIHKSVTDRGITTGGGGGGGAGGGAGGGGTEWPPDTSHQEISANLPGKERQRKKGKMQKKENRKREAGKLIVRGKVTKWGEDFFLLFFFFAFHFSKPLKFVLGLPKWEFSTREKHFTLGKNSGKMSFPLLKHIPLTPLLTVLGNLHDGMLDITFWRGINGFPQKY